MKFSEFLKLGISEFQKKLASIPETEPLYNIIKFAIVIYCESIHIWCII